MENFSEKFVKKIKNALFIPEHIISEILFFCCEKVDKKWYSRKSHR